ncbi:MAG: rhodanese-like domain-containing protein [Flavobacteriales bacterium]|nr:rhodanese-like domain-containing protein [Flavobacteriales bacterium]MCX7769085.1 rhodanese-like domain-containing protein [Flavobacteriales bacterium]MDW8410457.1 rhodanese-like domain-containing protein [Flavobacteriales bacterium]
MNSPAMNDPVEALTRAYAQAVSAEPLMGWEEFSALSDAHLNSGDVSSGTVPKLILVALSSLNVLFIFLCFPLFQNILTDASPDVSAAVLNQVVASHHTSLLNQKSPFFSSLSVLQETLPQKSEVAPRPHPSRVSPSRIVADNNETEVISEKISQYFDQLKTSLSSEPTEQYLRALLQAKDSLDRLYRISQEAEFEFGAVLSREKHYSEYLSPEEFVLQARSKNAVILDLRSSELYEKSHLKNALNVEFNLRNLDEMGSQIPPHKAIFLYGDNMKECESSKAFLWKKGFKTVYILNAPFRPEQFKKSDLVFVTSPK